MDTTIEFDPSGFGNAIGGAIGGIFSGVSAGGSYSSYGTAGGSASFSLGGLLNGLLGGGPAQVASSGISMTTILLLGLALLVIFFLVKHA